MGSIKRINANKTDLYYAFIGIDNGVFYVWQYKVF